MLSERVIVTHQHFVDRYLLYLFYKGKEKIEDKQVNNDFLLKLKNVSLFVVTNSSPVIGIGDPVASVGRLAFSITDRRNSSLRSSDTTGRAFGKPNRTLVPAPMVFRHKTLHLPSALQDKEGKFY